jgi:hypothetical protein
VSNEVLGLIEGFKNVKRLSLKLGNDFCHYMVETTKRYFDYLPLDGVTELELKLGIVNSMISDRIHPASLFTPIKNLKSLHLIHRNVGYNPGVITYIINGLATETRLEFLNLINETKINRMIESHFPEDLPYLKHLVSHDVLIRTWGPSFCNNLESLVAKTVSPKLEGIPFVESKKFWYFELHCQSFTETPEWIREAILERVKSFKLVLLLDLDLKEPWAWRVAEMLSHCRVLEMAEIRLIKPPGENDLGAQDIVSGILTGCLECLHSKKGLSSVKLILQGFDFHALTLTHPLQDFTGFANAKISFVS